MELEGETRQSATGRPDRQAHEIPRDPTPPRDSAKEELRPEGVLDRLPHSFVSQSRSLAITVPWGGLREMPRQRNTALGKQ